MSKRKINVPAPTKAELKAELKTLVKDYFEKGGVIKVYPTRHRLLSRKALSRIAQVSAAQERAKHVLGQERHVRVCLFL